MEIVEKIPDALVGERLDRVVSMIASCSRSLSASLIESGKVEVSGKVVSSRRYRVQLNQTVVVSAEELEEDQGPLADISVEFDTVYEDLDIVVVDKPSGLVVHPGSGNETRTLVNGLLARYPELAGVGQPNRPGIVHRLDKGTSGLMVVARTGTAYDALVSMLSKHQVSRKYIALVHGKLESAKGVVDAPIGRSSTRATLMGLSSLGRQAVTRYQVIEVFDTPMPASLIELELETGRTHQIRVHMSAIGHPVVGDAAYSRRSAEGLERIFLHSLEISFAHPTTGRAMKFTSEVPQDLRQYLSRYK